jgi:hypothetical protein
MRVAGDKPSHVGRRILGGLIGRIGGGVELRANYAPERETSPMKFGLFYLPTYLPTVRDVQTHYRGIIEQVEFADRIGIDVWLVEHHFVRHGGLFPANYAFLAYLAARTKHIRLGTGATVLPLNDPVRVAGYRRSEERSGHSGLWFRQFAFSNDARIRFVQILDAIFELAPVLWEPLSHLVGSAWHIPTNCGLEGHNVANLEFV